MFKAVFVKFLRVEDMLAFATDPKKRYPQNCRKSAHPGLLRAKPNLQKITRRRLLLPEHPIAQQLQDLE